MLEYAKGQFELDQPQDDGNALRHHLKQARGGWIARKDARLTARCPAHYEYLWEWFCDLDQERQFAGPRQPLPLTSRDVQAWASLSGVPIKPHEYTVLRLLDRVYIGVMRGH